jgi:hypothetical protein
MVVVRVRLHVLSELGDPLGQECDLHSGRAGVFPIPAVLPDDLRLLLLGKRHAYHLLAL